MPLLDPAILDRQLAARSPASVSRVPRELLKRAALLLPADRLLVRLALEDRISRRRIGQILQLPAGTVTRRLQRLGARLHDPLVLSLLREECPLPTEYRQLGIEHFLQARSMRELADSHRMSLNEVRRIISYIRGWHRGLTAAATLHC